VKTYFLIFLAGICLFVYAPLHAQKPKARFKKGGMIKLQDSLTSYSQSDIF